MSDINHDVTPGGDGSGAPIKEAAFPKQKRGDGKQQLSPRQDEISDIVSNFEAFRDQNIQEELAADPGLQATKNKIDASIEFANAQNAAAAATAAAEGNDGAASRQPLHQTPDPVAPVREVPAPTVIVEPAPNDPTHFPEYISIREGKIMMEQNVDGQIVYQDLDTIHANAQINSAADVRIQEASEWQKNLQTREKNLQQQVQQFQTLQNEQPANPLPAPRADVDELDIGARSTEIVHSFFTGTEKEAATLLAKTLNDLGRGTPQTQLNVDEIVDRAKTAAREVVATDRTADRELSAWNDFKKSEKDGGFKDVFEDPEAFAFADSQTGAVEKANPDWTPQQVMMEVGKRARSVVIESKRIVAAQQEDVVPDDPNANRLQLKSNLVSIPQPRSLAHNNEVVEEKPQTAAEAFAEIKASRGQAM